MTMISNGFYVSLRQTDIINVDEDNHPLPPDKGPFKEFAVADYPACPKEWSKDGIFIPVEEGQPLWIDFRGNVECAVICSIQRLNPVTGQPVNLDSGLSKNPNQNYLRLPEQKWLDGYSKDGKVYQFMVTKAGIGLAVSEYVLPAHMQDSHALGFAFYAPKIERKPHQTLDDPLLNMSAPQFYHQPKIRNARPSDALWQYSGTSFNNNVCKGVASTSIRALTASLDNLEPENSSAQVDCFACVDTEISSTVMGAAPEDSVIDTVDILSEPEKTVDQAAMGMGGRIFQQIIRDANTPEFYHEKPAGILTIYLALTDQFKAIMKVGKKQTGKKKDKYTYSGEVGGIQVPLIKS